MFVLGLNHTRSLKQHTGRHRSNCIWMVWESFCILLKSSPLKSLRSLSPSCNLKDAQRLIYKCRCKTSARKHASCIQPSDIYTCSSLWSAHFRYIFLTMRYITILDITFMYARENQDIIFYLPDERVKDIVRCTGGIYRYTVRHVTS